MENLYEYPELEYLESFEKELANKKTVVNKAILLCIFVFMLSGILFIIYCVPSLEKISGIVLFFAIVLIFIGTSMVQKTQKNFSLHQLAIVADNENLKLIYYQMQGKYRKQILEVAYKDIISARFSDNKQESFQIIFHENFVSSLKSYDKNANEIANQVSNLMMFNINPHSYEQGYFLYFARQYFDIKGFDLNKKMLKKYGTQEEYYSNLD